MSDWWGEFELDSGVSRHWRIGPLSVWVTRMAREWQIAHCWSSDPFDEAIEIARADVEIPATVQPRRYLFASETARLHLTPRVADRPVVTRPELPLIIPGGESATIYMASPLWVEFGAGVGKTVRAFAELPVWRASSTWFGDDTLEGTLCYATRTRARVEPGDVRGPRITTAARIRNDHDEPLRVERLALPLPQMSVYRDAEGQLWTEATTVAYAGAGTGPARIESAPPPEAGPTSLISRPRQDRQTNVLARALTAALRGVV